MKFRLGFVLSLSLLVLSGCGGGTDKPVAKVTGKVTFEGNPVTGGSINYAPTGGQNAGKPGFGTIGADGTFQISTYGTNDGAVISKGKLSYSAPPPKEISPLVNNPDGSHTPAVVEESPYANLKVETVDVEIKAGSNTLDVKLIK